MSKPFEDANWPREVHEACSMMAEKLADDIDELVLDKYLEEKGEKMGINDPVEIRATVIRTTPYAYLVDDGSVRDWLPAELMDGIVEIGEDTIEFDIPMWLAREKGFI